MGTQVIWNGILDFFKSKKDATLLSGIGDYKNQDSLLTVLCHKCKGQYKATWQSIRKGNRCNLTACNRKWNTENVTEFILSHGNGDLLVSTEYIDYNAELDIYCHKCFDIYQLDFAHFKRGGRCNLCYFSKEYTIKQVMEYIAGSEQKDTLVSTSYMNSYSPLQIKCGECEEIYSTTYNRYLHENRRCLDCFGTKKGYTQQEVDKIIANGGNTCVSFFITTAHDIYVRCKDCDKVYPTKLNAYINGKRCRTCAYRINGLNLRYSVEEVKEIVSKGGDSLVSNTYEGSDFPLKILCNHCNEVYIRSLHSFTRGNRCNICNDNRSAAVRCIDEYLKKCNYSYKREKYFEDCRNPLTNYRLPFDFYISHPRLLVEFHGEQHYTSNYFGGEKALKSLQYRDNLKVEYAKKHGIPLLIIPYHEWTKGNVLEILKKFIMENTKRTLKVPPKILKPINK